MNSYSVPYSITIQSMKLMFLPSSRGCNYVNGSSPQDFKTCLTRLRVIKMGPNKNALDRSKKRPTI